MKTNSSKTGFPDFFTDAKSEESVRRQFLEAPLEAARQSAFGPAFELAQLLTLLPDAFADSQRRELKRVSASGKENDPRVAALKASIEQADALRTMARRGEVRAQRSLVAFLSKDEVFHGFVSDSDLNPLRGLTVQISTGNERIAKEFSDTTDADGYFSISLPRKSRTQEASEKEAEGDSPEQFASLFARREKTTSVYQQLDGDGKGIRIEILKEGKLVHEDPVPIALDAGSAYREYIVSDKEPSSSHDFEVFISQQGDEPKTSAEDPKGAEPKASRAGTAGPASAAAPAARRRAKKKSTRKTKSTKPTSKK